MTRLPRSALERPVLEVAPDLLGCLLTAGGVTVRITEVEAYAGEADPGSHAFRGRTARTAVMFGRAGHLYVYFTYGMHWCANVVTGTEGTASAVLLRAGQVVAGHELAAGRRTGIRERDWARGPARLASTLGLDRAHNGVDLCGEAAQPRLEVAGGRTEPARVRTGPRVGVSGPGGDGTAYPWRFWIDGEPTVSVYRPGRRA
ncbi:MAG: DNA-3-methyladenine glycosylase [Dermatophilaceae bacterium]